MHLHGYGAILCALRPLTTGGCAADPEQAVPEGYMTGVHDGGAQQYGIAHAAGAYEQNAQLAYDQQMAQVCVVAAASGVV